MAFTLLVNKTIINHRYLLAAHPTHLPPPQKHSLCISGSVNTNEGGHSKHSFCHPGQKEAQRGPSLSPQFPERVSATSLLAQFPQEFKALWEHFHPQPEPNVPS